MCKHSCCPTTSTSGPHPLATIAAALLVTAVIAGPVAAAAASLLHALVLIATITAATLAGITVLALAVVIIRRTRRSPGHHSPIPVRTQRAHPLPMAAPLALPSPGPRFELTQAERARCAAVGADPDQVAQIMAAVLGGPQ